MLARGTVGRRHPLYRSGTACDRRLDPEVRLSQQVLGVKQVTVCETCVAGACGLSFSQGRPPCVSLATIRGAASSSPDGCGSRWPIAIAGTASVPNTLSRVFAPVSVRGDETARSRAWLGCGFSIRRDQAGNDLDAAQGLKPADGHPVGVRIGTIMLRPEVTRAADLVSRKWTQDVRGTLSVQSL